MTFRTLRELYLHSIATYADRPCFSMYEREETTYAQFGQRVDSVRKMLLQAGLCSGDKVALLSTNMPNWGVCYFAIVTEGMIAVPILPDFSGEELDMILIHSDAKALLVSDKLYTRVSRDVIQRMNIVIRTKNLGIITQRVAEQGRFAEPQPEDVAVIIYTSGTTSKPKGVMLSHRNLCTQVAMEYDLFPVYPDDVFLSILPLSHTYECSVGMLYPFSVGASVVYLDRPPTASNLMPALRDVRPTIMLSVPLVIDKIYKSQVLAKMNSNTIWRFLYGKALFRKRIHRMAGKRLIKVFGGRLRFFGIGGAKLDPATERFLLEGRFPYAIGYGLTETAPLIAGAAPSMIRLGSTGPVLKGIEARLEGMNPATGEGEIVVKSPSAMIGYYKNPVATAEVITPDGWLHTRDLGLFDADGYLYIKGRLNNMIVGPSGENIYPEEIESVINGHMLVTDSIVKEERGRLVAMVRFDRAALERKYYDLKDEWGTKMDELKAEVLRYVNSKVNKFSRIAEVEVHEGDFEKTPTQKIKRYLYMKGNTRRQKENQEQRH